MFASLALLIAVPALSYGQAPAKRSIDTKHVDTKYLDVVRRSAEALLRSALDTQGKQTSGMILSVLDRQTGIPLTKLPKSPYGVRQSDRCVLGGSNMNLQQDLCRTLMHLSRLTGDPRYDKAAREAMVDCLRVTQNDNTGFVAWGEHLCWNCVDDCPGSFVTERMIHEPKRKILFFDLWYDTEPQRTLAFAKGLWEHQIYDQITGNFCRHATYDKHGPRKDHDFEKEASYFIDCWSRAYEKTKDPVYQQAVTVLTNRYLNKLDPETNLVEIDSSKTPGRENMCTTLWQISIAMEADPASRRMDPSTRELLEQLAIRHDRGFLALDHDVSNPERGFVCYADTVTGKPRDREEKQSNGYSRHWSMGYGINPTSMFGLLSFGRQAQLNDDRAAAYRQLVTQAADVYCVAAPEPNKDDIWAGEYGLAISVELAAFRLTGNAKYLDQARRLADDSIALLWDGGAVLPRASSKTSYYDCVSYPDILLLSFLALHEHTNGIEPQVEISTLIR